MILGQDGNSLVMMMAMMLNLLLAALMGVETMFDLTGAGRDAA